MRSPAGERELPLLELYRRPTDGNRSLVALAAGELVVAVRLPALRTLPPTSAPGSGRRSRSRSSRSRPPARDGELTLVAAGVANIPRALDPADPLAGLPGPSAERLEAQVLATLVERASAAVAG